MHIPYQNKKSKYLLSKNYQYRQAGTKIFY